jgi:hypothetical protein
MMRLQFRFRFVLLIAALALLLVVIPLPTVGVEAAPAQRQYTITITEAQLNKYLPSVKPRISRAIVADIIDGGIIIKISTIFRNLPQYHEHYGVLVRNGRISVEAGVFDIPGVGALGYADVKRLIPQLVPSLDHNARTINRYVLRQVSAKAGSRYKVESITTGNDQVVIVVSR